MYYGCRFDWFIWVYIPIYQEGAKEIKEDQIAIKQEDGTELILSPYHGGMMTQLHKGDSVLTKEQTQTLFKLSELPQSRLREMFSTHIPDDAAFKR